MITPHASPPTAPAQMPALDRSWYHSVGEDNAAQVAEDWQANIHGDEIRASHGCAPSPEAAVAMGVTPASGG
jgi:hypothetical protein